VNRLLLGAAVAAGTYLLRDRTRRQRTLGAVRRLARTATDRNDPAIKNAVESEIFRPDDAPKGDVNVNVEYGIVVLRGEVPDREWMQRFVAGARGVRGVVDVRNLMHLPGEPAPTAEPYGARFVREHAAQALGHGT
jgi:osmotically-inducible protein OsmY